MPAFVWFLEQAYLAKGPFRCMARATCGARTRKVAHKFQKELYFLMLPELHPRDVLDTCRQRAGRVPVWDAPMAREAFAAVFVEAAKKGQQAVVAVMKTLRNGWTTTTRMHEASTLPCIPTRSATTSSAECSGSSSASCWICPRGWLGASCLWSLWRSAK